MTDHNTEGGKKVEACCSCRFWRFERATTDWDNKRTEYGICRLTPPTVTAMATTVNTKWPDTRDKDWCGKHEGKDRK